jgi:molybdate transport system substrate-binding protein
LPDAVQITTTFSGSVAATSAQYEAVRDLLAFWASAATQDTKVRHGMVAA